MQQAATFALLQPLTRERGSFVDRHEILSSEERAVAIPLRPFNNPSSSQAAFSFGLLMAGIHANVHFWPRGRRRRGSGK